jgi:hypothetical protein
MHFLDSKGILSHYRSLEEQLLNDAEESTINSIMIIASKVMAESGLAGRFCSKATVSGKDAGNLTIKASIGGICQAKYCEKEKCL